MYAKFNCLPEEKKDRIISAALKEFAENGYEKASTNQITKNASISKGILFHYFGNKKNLYLYIFEHCVQKSMELIKKYTVKPSNDLFEMIIQQGYIKLRIALEEPLLYTVLFDAYINTPDEILKITNDKYSFLVNTARQELRAYVDTTCFREDVDIDKAIETVLVFFEGLFNRYREKYKTMTCEESLQSVEDLIKDTEIYMDILKNGIYKK